MDKLGFIERDVGPYRTTALIGGGTISSVYRAQHVKSGKNVALRVMPPSAKPGLLPKLKVELAAIRALNNPHIVPIVDFGVHEKETIYIAMPLLRGGTLKERLDRREEAGVPLPSPAEVATLLAQMASALDYIHSLDMVHCQVEPQNILFDRKGDAYLADIGLSRLFKITFSLRSTGAVATQMYSSPEQWRGGKQTSSTDQYSLGMVAYLVLTGEMPFKASTLYQLMQQHLDDMIAPPHTIRANLPASLTIPLVRALAKKPEERYATVSTFHEEFAKEIKGFEGNPTGFFTFEVKS